jgi:glycosyltransferase involved in cell wall biosynthesis
MGKTVIVTNSPGGGGAERTMNSLANLLHHNLVDVSIFPINEGEMDAVVPICEVIAPVRHWKDGLLPTLFSFVAFRAKIAKANPQFVIANCELPELYTVFLPLRIKLVFVEHTSRPWRNRRLIGFLVRLLARFRSTDWVLVSDHLERKKVYRKPISVIPNLISVNEHRLAEGNSPSPRLVFIGRLSYEKDPQLFLEITKLVGQSATIIGSGVLAHELAVQSEKENLSIRFTGQLNNPWGEIHRNDIVVITSQYEGDGLVLLEAISRNLPILVRDIPDLRRFGLPDLNYFQTTADATQKLLGLKENSDPLRVPSDTITRILSTRNENTILGHWVELIKRFTTP